MSWFLKRRDKRRDKRLASVEFCDSCGKVCDGRCRSERLLEQSWDRAIQHRRW